MWRIEEKQLENRGGKGCMFSSFDQFGKYIFFKIKCHQLDAFVQVRRGSRRYKIVNLDLYYSGNVDLFMNKIYVLKSLEGTVHFNQLEYTVLVFS